MSEQKRALLLVGSPRAGDGVSVALGGHVMARLAEQGLEGETLRLKGAMLTEKGREALLAAVRAADLIVLATPLYVDALPAPVVSAMELIRDAHVGHGQRLAVIINSGFPEAHQNQVALGICRRFCREVGMEWAGGLAFGGGGAMGGKPVAQLGGNMRHVPQALDVAAAALARGEAVPAEAVALLAKPLMPARLYAGMGSLGFALQAANNRCLRRLWDRPYEAEPQMNTDGHR